MHRILKSRVQEKWLPVCSKSSKLWEMGRNSMGLVFKCYCLV